MIVRYIVGVLLILAAFPGQAETVVKYVHTDALGSVVAITDANRNVIERREYEPYGAQLTPSVQDGPGYTGHVQDAATGLVYMQQRYYDPGIGRFLSVDPVTAYSSPVGAFNRYWYGNSNPYGFIDPDGRYSCDPSLCRSVRAGVAAMKRSRNTYRRGSAEYKIANAVILSLGTEGDGHGPNYQSGTLDGEASARTDQKGNVIIDMTKVAGDTDMARNLAHEGQHDIDAAVNGVASSEEAVHASETNAYTTEAIIANGLNVRLDPKELGDAVEKSVNNWKKRDEEVRTSQ